MNAGTDDDRERAIRTYGRYSTLGLQFSLFIVLYTLAGYWLDQWLGSEPWFLLVGVLFGFVGGTVWLYRQVYPPESRGSSEEEKPKGH